MTLEGTRLLELHSSVSVDHLDKLREDFKICFGDLDNIHVPKWLVAPFDVKIYNKVNKSDLEDELIEMHVDLKAKALLKSKNIAKYWSNINTATKYP